MKKVLLLAGLLLAGFFAMRAALAGNVNNAGQITYDKVGRPMAIRDSAGRSVVLSFCDGDRAHACDVRWSSP